MDRKIEKRTLVLGGLGFFLFLLIVSSMASPLLVYLTLLVLSGLVISTLYLVLSRTEQKGEQGKTEEPKKEIKEEPKAEPEQEAKKEEKAEKQEAPEKEEEESEIETDIKKTKGYLDDGISESEIRKSLSKKYTKKRIGEIIKKAGTGR